MNNICLQCGQVIQQMCRKGTGICGEICEKERYGRRPGDAADQPNIEADLTEPVRAEPDFGGPELERSFTRSASSEAAVGA